MRKLWHFLPHLALAMTLGLGLLVYLEGRNPLMRFLNSPTSRVYISVTVILCLIMAVRCIVYDRKR